MSKELAKTYELTEMQARFVQHVAEGVDPNRAAELAGYDTSNVYSRANDLLRTPHILAAIHKEVRRKLVAAAPIALSVIERMVVDEKTPSKIRLDAAKTILDRAGHIAPRAIVDKSTHDLELHELSLPELRQLADKLESELADRAKDVSRANIASAGTQSVDEIEDTLA